MTTLGTASRFIAIALTSFALGGTPMAIGQVTPPGSSSGQDHDAHHPDAKSTPEAKPGMPPAMGQGGMMQGGMMQGGMMQGDMKRMMSMMNDMMAMMSAHSGMMAAHVEGRIAALKTEFKVTDAQMPQWNRFADALRGVAKTMGALHQHPMMAPAKPTTLRESLAQRETAIAAHLAALKTLDEALQPLYASLTDEQKKIADGVRIGPMGMM